MKGRAYRIYGELCMAKHGNPRLQMQVATVQRGDEFICVPGPFPIQEAERVTAYALENAILVTSWALSMCRQTGARISRTD